MQAIGIAGESGAGKGTLGAFLSKELMEQGWTSKTDSVIQPLRMKARQRFGRVSKVEHRSWLRDQVAKWRKIHPKSLINRISILNHLSTVVPFDQPADFLIVTDVRRPEEAALCLQYGVLLFIQGSHRPLCGEDAAHESETSVQAVRRMATHIVPACETLEALAAYAEHIVAVGFHMKKEENPR